MGKTIEKHKLYWLQKSYLTNTFMGVFLLAASLFINRLANFYTTSHVSNSVTDILLDNLPTVDVHLIFSEGAILFVLVLAAILIFEPKYIPFVLKSVALFIIVRSFFLILTHLAPPQNGLIIDPTDFVQKLSSGNDLFFSAHTGLPFLLAFIFWKKKYLKYFFLASTLIGGASVLLGHLHYSIDVASALFISFGIFSIAKIIFPKDYILAFSS